MFRRSFSRVKWIAGMIILLYGFYEKICKPPRHLRHLAYNNIFISSWKMITGVPTRMISRSLALPLMVQNPQISMFCRLERFGWTVHIVHPECAKKVLTSPNDFPKLIDTDFAGTLAGKFLAGPNVMSLEGDRWKAHRMVVNPAFHRALPIQLFGETTERLFKTLDGTCKHDDWTTPFTLDVADMLFKWSLDVLGLALFGFDFEGLTGKTDNPWALVYKQFDRDVKKPHFVLFPALDQQYRWLFPTRQAAHDNLDQFHHLLRGVIKERRLLLEEQQQQKQGEKDLLTLMIESGQNGVDLSDEELLNNLCVFFAAGHDTTANALSFALYYLAKGPDIQQKARQEAIRILCGDDDDEPKMDILPTTEQTKEMRYILQIIKETLRYNGTVVSLVTPRVVANDHTVLMGHHLPKGTPVTVNIYDLHHNPNVWKFPEVFDPSRFDPGGEAEHHPNGPISWMPFGLGTRKCIGFKFNIGEQLVLLSMLLRKYEWTLPDNSIHHEYAVTNNIVVMNPIDMKITFKRRY